MSFRQINPIAGQIVHTTLYIFFVILRQSWTKYLVKIMHFRRYKKIMSYNNLCQKKSMHLLAPFPQNNVEYLLSFRKLKKKSSKSRHRTRAWHKRPPNWDFEKLGRRPKETPIFEKSFVIF